MAAKTKLMGDCPKHGEFYMDAPDSPCPSCEEAVIVFPQMKSGTADEIDDVFKVLLNEFAKRVDN